MELTMVGQWAAGRGGGGGAVLLHFTKPGQRSNRPRVTVWISCGDGSIEVRKVEKKMR
jgi:hypothetical protein